MGLKRICAWCLADLGEIESTESGITHCLCASCTLILKTKSILTKQHLAVGLALEEDDDVIQLKKWGQTLAVFTVHTPRYSILEEANKYLES